MKTKHNKDKQRQAKKTTRLQQTPASAQTAQPHVHNNKKPQRLNTTTLQETKKQNTGKASATNTPQKTDKASATNPPQVTNTKPKQPTARQETKRLGTGKARTTTNTPSNTKRQTRRAAPNDQRAECTTSNAPSAQRPTRRAAHNDQRA